MPGTYDAAGPELTAPPSFDPMPGTFSTTVSVTLTSKTPGAIVYYTADGTVPNTSSPKYSAPIAIKANMTIKAFALAAGFRQSGTVTGEYVISPADAGTD